MIGDDVVDVGAYSNERGRMIIKRKAEELDGKKVYFLDAWVFSTFFKCYPEVDQLVVFDTGVGKAFSMSVDKAKNVAIRDASNQAGREWAIRVSDIDPDFESRQAAEKKEEGAFGFL